MWPFDKQEDQKTENKQPHPLAPRIREIEIMIRDGWMNNSGMPAGAFSVVARIIAEQEARIEQQEARIERLETAGKNQQGWRFTP